MIDLDLPLPQRIVAMICAGYIQRPNEYHNYAMDFYQPDGFTYVGTIDKIAIEACTALIASEANAARLREALRGLVNVGQYVATKPGEARHRYTTAEQAARAALETK